MNMLMADLIDISRIESGQFSMDKQPFSFNALLTDVVALQNGSAQKKGIYLQTCEYPTDITITADRFRISQVINNLLGNAIKFSPQGGRIEARFYVDNGKLTFLLSDNGPGVIHSEKDKIFQKFRCRPYRQETRLGVRAFYRAGNHPSARGRNRRGKRGLGPGFHVLVYHPAVVFGRGLPGFNFYTQCHCRRL